MKFKLEIQCDNAVFEDQCGDEVARILKRAADQIEGGKRIVLGGFTMPLRDVYGNTVGKFTYTKRGK